MADSPADDIIQLANVGGGSLMIAWQLKGKTVLIVGGGEVASQRIESVLGTDAHIVVLSPQKGLHHRTKQFIHSFPQRITYHDHRFEGLSDLQSIDLVLTAIDDNQRSREIVELCRTNKVPVNAADIPDLCDFFFGAQIRDGPLQVMISTNGNGPRLSGLIKKKLQAGLSGYEGEAIKRIGELRAKLKDRAPGVGGTIGRKRMKWMTQLCNQWEMVDFTQLDEPMMQSLLDEGWEKDCIPSIETLGGKHLPKAMVKDGSRTVSFSSTSSILPASLGLVAGAVLAFTFMSFTRRPC